MINDETIICISPSSWFSLWRNRQQIMSRLARNNRVLFVEPQRDPDLGTWLSIRNRISNIFSPHIESISANMTLLHPPPSLPFGGAILSPRILHFIIPLIVKMNCWLLTNSIRQALRKMKVENHILYVWEPFQLDLIGKFGEKLVCYHVYDEISDFIGNKRIKGIIWKYDRLLCKRADFVFASSRTQYKRRKAFNQSTYFIPNGVDFEHFNQALSPDTKLPEDIQSVPRPILGFAGLIANFTVDIKLLIELAVRCPEWSFVIIGQDEMGHGEAGTKLHGLDNFLYLGKKEVSGLPNYFKAFDVALMPYVIKGHTLSIYPLKLHEYLAAGLPIVTTHLPELYPFKDIVRLAKTVDEFIEQVEKSLKDNSEAAVAKRVAVAKKNTWDQRVEKIEKCLLSRHRIRYK